MKLKTLTPVHIGDGEYYTNLSYLVHQGNMYVIDTEALSVFTQEQMEQWLRCLAMGRGQDLNSFVSQYPGLRQKIIGKAKYCLPLHGAASQKVFTFIKSADHAYIPGTEVKGALRTALLSALLIQQPLKQKLIQELHKFGKEFPRLQQNKKALAERAKELETSLHAIAFRPCANDARYDLLKLLFVSDSDAKRLSEVLVVAPVQSVGLQKRLPEQSHEVAKYGVEFSLELTITSGKPRDEFLTKFKFDQLHHDILRDRHALFKIAYQFYDKVLEEEISYFKSRGVQYSEVVAKLQQIKNLNAPDSPVIRLGKHQGYLSLTLGLLLKNQALDLYQKCVLPLIKGRINPQDFPKTRKLVELNGELFPLGWVQLC